MTDGRKFTARANAQCIWIPALQEAGMAFAAAAVLLIIFYVFAFRSIHPEFIPFMDRESTKLIVPGKDLIPISVGAYRVEGTNSIVEDFNGDEAILVLTRPFQAEDYPFIKVNLSGLTRYPKVKILWQQAGHSATHALELNRSGDDVTQIAMVYGSEAYSGKINSIALLFYDGPALGVDNNNGNEIAVKSVEFRAFSAQRVAQQIFEDWTNPPLWSGSSNNIVRGIHVNGMVFPNAVANLLVITGFVFAALVRWIRQIKFTVVLQHRLLFTALCLCIYGWAFNDALRWHWRIEQAIDTYERYAGLPLEERIRNNDIRCARFPEGCADHLLPHF